MLQLGLVPGDGLQLGERTFVIRAALLRMAGESDVAGFFAPRIYIRGEDLDATGLIQHGSIVRYREYFRFDDGLTDFHQEELDRARVEIFAEEGIRAERVADRRRSLEQVLNNLFDFLNLIGFIALLLGGLGVGSAVHVFLQGKTRHMALLRCLGARAATSFRVYFLQVIVVGWLGALVGALAGVAVQFWMPGLLRPFLPFDVTVTISPAGILSGLLFGGLIALLFSLFPLLKIRRVSPLSLLREGVEPPALWRDPFAYLVGGALVAVLTAFSVQQSASWRYGLVFVAGLMASLVVLAVLAVTLRAFLRRLGGRGGPYVWRLGLSNLYRPQNRTILLVVTLGMGVMLIHSLFLVRHALLSQIEGTDTRGAANVILLDVQPDQRDALESFLAGRGYEVRDVLPIVTMRVSHLNGEDLRSLRADPDSGVADWIFNWEFRNTWRDHVLDNAEVVAGEFIGFHDGGEPFPVSLSENVLEDMNIRLGDHITWNVQGIPIETRVSSVRRVRWQAGRQNFNIVFPVGTIEDAPTIYAVTLSVSERRESATLQNELVRDFPNVSLIDLALIFETVNRILDRAAFVIQFMAAFTIATGLTVLAGSILTSRYQRRREGVLLRAMGASGGFIRRLLSIEFLILGAMSAIAGTGLSVAAAWWIVTRMFNQPFQIDVSGLWISVLALMLLTWLTGLWSSRGIANRSPSDALRQCTI